MPVQQIAVEGGALPVAWRGQGRALLMLHGWTLDHRMWAPQLVDLSKEFLLIAPDRRGFGSTALAPDLARELDDIDAILDHFGLEQACILGMSQGGRIALRYAAERPARLRGLILHGAPLDGFNPPPNKEDRIPFETYRQWAQQHRMDKMRDHWRAHVLMTLPNDRPDLRALADAMLTRYSGADLLAAMPAAPASNLAARLAEIAAPTLALLGEHDSRWLHLVADTLAYGLPHCRKVVVAGGGHLINLTHPVAYNAALRAFLSSIG